MKVTVLILVASNKFAHSSSTSTRVGIELCLCSSISPHPGRAPTSSFLFTHPPHPVIHSGCFADPSESPHGTLAAAFSRTVRPRPLRAGPFSQPAHAADARAPQVSSQIAAGRRSTPSPTPLRSHLAPSLVRSASHSDEQRQPLRGKL